MKKFHFRDEQKGLLFLLLIVLIIVVLVVILRQYLAPKGLSERIEADQVMRTVFVVDDEEGNVIFTNLLIYYPVSCRGAVVSIPGNTGAIYEVLGRVDGISSVYKEKGIDAYVSEIEKLLDVQIPFYAVCHKSDFEKMADMLGGLRLFLPIPVDETSETGERWLLPGGSVVLDGDKVSVYLDYRLEEDENSDVNDRLLNVAVAFFTALHEKKGLVFSSQENSKRYASLLQMNLSEEDKLDFLDLISSVDSDSLVKQTITGNERNVDGRLLLFPERNGDEIKNSVKQSTVMLLSTGASAASRFYVLEILNGTERNGLAKKTAERYKNASYDVHGYANTPDNKLYEKTTIIDHIGDPDVAKIVGDYIKCSNIVEEEIVTDEDRSESEANVDFTIILGDDFDGRFVR